jgi:hypothetical protein
MPLWGNQDKVTVGGLYNISAAGVLSVQGATGFPTSVKSGDSIVVGTNEYVVKTVTGSTGLTVFVNEYGATGVLGATGQTIYFQEKPKNLLNFERPPVYGVDVVEMGASGPDGFAGTPGPGHAGWVQVTQHSGYVKEVNLAVAGATGYDPSALPPVIFSGTGGASGVAVVSATGVLTGVTVTDGGVYTTTAPTVTVGATGATGIQATNVVMGGRFNRKTFETLVAMRNITGDAENNIFPNS